MKNLKYLFGPAPSRRLGRSLGINIVPSKICSMNCIYCEAGVTKSLTVNRNEYFSAEEIVDEFKNNFHRFKDITDVITITGAGEPTLNSRLDDIFDGIKKYSGNTPVAILTNATMLHCKEVFDCLLKFDIVVPSLDSVTDENMQKADKLHKSLSPVIIRENIKKFCIEYKGKLFLETLFCKGINDSEKDIIALAEFLKGVPITKLQLGTVTRPPADSSAEPVSEEFLEKTADFMRLSGLPAETSKTFSRDEKSSIDPAVLENRVEALLKLRPCTAKDIAGVFGTDVEQAETCLLNLVNKNIVLIKEFKEKFYHHKDIPYK